MSKIDHFSPSRPDVSEAALTQAGVRRLHSLAPLPRTSQQLLQMLSDPDLDMLRLAEVVEQTPALAARILGVANSAFFANARTVRDIPDAIIRVLGLNLVRDLSTSFVLSQPFDLTECPRFDVVRYWSAAMESALLAQMFASQLREADSPTPAEAYLGGLLHNLGLLALIHVAPEAMNAVFALSEREPLEDLSTHEVALLGIGHAQAGAELAAVWHLPPLLAVAMGPPNARPQCASHRRLLSILRLCAEIRRCEGSQLDPSEEPTVIAATAEAGFMLAITARTVAHWRELSKEIAELASAFAGGNS